MLNNANKKFLPSLKKIVAILLLSFSFITLVNAQPETDIPKLSMPIAHFYLGLGAATPSKKNATGELFGGYLLKWDSPFLYSLEVFINTTQTDGKTPVYGARLLPGLQLTDSLFFFTDIGYIRQTQGGIQLGLGVQQNMANWLSLRAGYLWNVFKEGHRNYSQFTLAAVFLFNV